MSGEENLIPMNKRSKEEIKEIAGRGGRKSGETRRRKRDLKNIVNMMLNADLTDANKKKVDKICPNIPDEALTVNALLVAGQIKSAYQGNTKAFQALAEYQNQAQKDVKEERYTIPITDITKDFVEAYRARLHSIEILDNDFYSITRSRTILRTY